MPIAYIAETLPTTYFKAVSSPEAKNWQEEVGEKASFVDKVNLF